MNKIKYPILANTLISFFAALSLIEVFTYPGFLLKHPNFLYVSLLFGFGVFLISKILYKRRIYKVAISAVAIAALTIYFASNMIENLTYSNFIFSRFHFNPQLLLLFVILTSVLYVINSGEKQAKLFLGVIIILAIGQYIFKDINNYKSDDPIFMLKNLNLDNKTKMKMLMGRTFYDYTIFINNNTEKNSLILIPPQGYPWPQTGNIAYLRYFIYPRNLINGGEKEPNIDLQKFDYVLVVYGESDDLQYGFTHVWPKFNVPSEYILYWNPVDGSVKKDELKEYVYSSNNNNMQWGIIKVKKQ